MAFGNRVKNAINAFLNRSPTINTSTPTYSRRPDRPRLTRGNERSIITAIYNRIALDVSALSFKHCMIDDKGRYTSDQNSSLNYCLNNSVNIDQTYRAFIADVVMSMLDEGAVAIVPIDIEIKKDGTFDIETMRVGKIVEWRADEITVEAYNDKKGIKERIVCKKNTTAVIENPFYSVMNEPNSTLQRLLRKLVLLDAVDEQTSSGKLDLIIQLPYVVKSTIRQQEAEKRRKSLEEQLSGSRYGIGYVDSTERITQLNRSLDNNLLKQIEYLTNLLYSQLGITIEIMNGTANEETMLNYQHRVIEPIADAIVLNCKRAFLTREQINNGETIKYFNQPFNLVPSNQLAELADKFTRNEIMTTNEWRQIIGFMPSDDPKADMLINSNLKHPNEPYGEDENYEESEE